MTGLGVAVLTVSILAETKMVNH
eukprot:SAG31_NODE_28075_length_415_cov_14.398734_1_plen_22_part_10